ncbi:hypothetical protein L208DRAFT_1490911 [Tricholoma matsutake]|nr:hypothetical protein L208DRAFT_1490911 [Tricholoma matsutake 945]
MLQRQAVLLHTSLKVKKSNFKSAIARFGTVSADMVHRVSDHVARGDYLTAYNEEEKQVLILMKEVNVITSHVVDHLLEDDVPKFWEQLLLVAKNPFVAAKFFNIYMKAFIKCLLGYDPHSPSLKGRILGIVKGYYGCAETQG